MTFELPTMMPLLIVLLVGAALTAASLITLAAAFLVQNRKVRVARHEPIRAYYGHLILGH